MIQIAILALVGAFIGYLTNVLAIKLLFRPIKPSKFFGIQGVIPKRQSEIAISIGQVVEEELLSINEILDKITEDMDKKEILESIKLKIIKIISKEFRMYAMFSGVIDPIIDNIFEKEGDKLLTEMSEQMIHKVTSSISIREMVQEKIMNLDLLQMEQIILKIAKKELKHIEYLGGILGFMIGVVQGVIIHFI